ncbi:MAG: TetR/AcrR family transcriptional regulator [Dehalococcoidia bacterium]
MARGTTGAPGGRKDELIRVATRLFSRRGFHGTSMGAIAEETGIHKASLYHWIESKEDLLFQVLSGALDTLIAQARAIATDTNLDFTTKLRRMVTLHANYSVSHRDVMQVFYAESKWLTGSRGRQMRADRREYHQIYDELFHNARERGEISVEEDVIPIYINSLFAMANELSQWYRDEGPYSPTDLGALMSDLVLGAVLPEHVKDAWRAPR